MTNSNGMITSVSRLFGMSKSGEDRHLSKKEIRMMRVSTLRSELQKRGIPSDGLKEELVFKLQNELFPTFGSSHVECDDKVKKKNANSIKCDHNILHVLRFKGDSNHLAASASFGAILYNTETEKPVWKGRLFLKSGESTQQIEYIGLLRSIKFVHDLGVKQLILQGDQNSTVVKHFSSKNQVKAKSIKKLFHAVNAIIQKLEHCEIWGIDPIENQKASSLSKIAMKKRSSDGFDTVTTTIHSNEIRSTVNDINHANTLSKIHKPPKAFANDFAVNLPTLSPKKKYILRFDGGSRCNPGIGGCGMVLFDLESQLEIWSAYKYIEHATNNEAEYSALCEGLKFAKIMGVKHLVAEGDSQLVINQVNGKFKVKQENLIPLYQRAHSLTKYFLSFQLKYIPREENHRADQLANVAMNDKASSDVIACDTPS